VPLPGGWSRRDWMAATAASLAAGWAQRAFAKAPAMSVPVIDTHQHLWDLSRFTLPWHQSEDVGPLRHSFVMRDYLAATQGLNVVKTIYMEVDVAPEQQVAEAEYVLDLCQRDDNPMVGAVISGRPASAEFATYIRRFATSPHLKGVRQVLHGGSTPTGYCLQPQFVKSVQLLGELGLRYDLCMRPGELADAVKLVKQCPQTKFVVDHCGNLGVTNTDADLRAKWEAGLKALAALPNTVCKISGIVASASKNFTAADLAPNMNFTMDAFGEDRVMFAGDWPVCTLRATFAQWLGALKEIVRDRRPEFQRKLFHDNAAKFYGV
jgi:L-fuconolactonase